MLQRKITSVLVIGMLTVLLFLMAGCGKKKTEPLKKKRKIVAEAKTTKIPVKKDNLVINPSFEEGEIFNSGTQNKVRKSKEKPIGWTAKGQILDDSKGWVSDEAHTGKRSLKIENIGGTKGRWEGEPVVLKEPAKKFEFSTWTKAENMKDETGKGKFKLFIIIVYLRKDEKTGKMVEYNDSISIDIAKSEHDWKKISKKSVFRSDIIKIVPVLIFSDMTGEVWFDDIDIRVIN